MPGDGDEAPDSTLSGEGTRRPRKNTQPFIAIDKIWSDPSTIGRVTALAVGPSVVLVALGVIAKHVDIELLSAAAPADAGELMRVMWAVYAGVVALSIPILLLAIELPREEGLVAVRRTQVLLADTKAQPVSLLALPLCVTFGVLASYVADDSVLMICLAAFALVLGLIVRAYVNAIALLSSPTRLEDRAQALLLSRLDSAVIAGLDDRRMNQQLFTEAHGIGIGQIESGASKRAVEAIPVGAPRSGWVSSIDIEELRSIAGELAAWRKESVFEVRASSEADEVDNDHIGIFAAAVGSYVSSGHPIAKIQGAADVESELLRRVQDLFKVADESATETFRRELGSIRDGTARAIADSAPAATRDGLNIYRELVRAVLARQRALSLDESDRVSTASYSHVMSWLEEDLLLFAVRVMEVGDSDALRAMLEFLDGILSECSDHRSVDVHRNVLAVFGRIWWLRHELPLANWISLRFSMLGRLTSHLDYRLTFRMSNEAVSLRLAQQSITELANMGKVAIDEERRDDIRAIVVALEDLFQEASRAIEYNTKLSAGERNLLQMREEALLALEAYVLTRRRLDRSDIDRTVDDYQVARSQPERELAWDVLWNVVRSDGSIGSRFDMWEMDLMEGRGGVRGGFLGFSHDAETAFSLRLLAGRTGLPRGLVGPNDVEPHARRHFFERIRESLVSERTAELALALSISTTRTDRLLSGLDYEIAKLNKDEHEIVAALPLSIDAVTAFEDALVDSWSSEGELRHLANVELVAEDPTPIDERLLYGTYQLIPKYFFAETHVHADAAKLGEDLGRRIARTETALGRVLLDQIVVREVGKADLRSSVHTEVKRLQEEGHDPQIIVFRSMGLVRLLADESVPDIDGQTVRELDGVPIFLDRSEGPEEVVVGDFEAALKLRRLPISNLPGSKQIEGGALVVGVREVNRERAEELVRANSDLRRSRTGQFISYEEAFLEQQQQVEVRAQSRFEWALGRADALVRLKVSDD